MYLRYFKGLFRVFIGLLETIKVCRIENLKKVFKMMHWILYRFVQLELLSKPFDLELEIEVPLVNSRLSA